MATVIQQSHFLRLFYPIPYMSKTWDPCSVYEEKKTHISAAMILCWYKGIQYACQNKLEKELANPLKTDTKGT